MTIEVFKAPTDGSGLRIAIAQARFNEPVCNALRDACVAELRELGVEDDDIFVLTVPGALEVPLALAGMARTGQFDALVAIGAVVRGETYHFEVVSNESAAGVMRVSLEHGIPVANAILTTETDEQAEDRAVAKGRDPARVAVEMANLHASLESMSVEDAEETDDDEDARS